MALKNMHIEDFYKESLKNKALPIPQKKSWKLIKEKNTGSREDLIAISEGKKGITYGEMFGRWDQSAKAFSALGITQENNSRVLALMPNVATTCDINYGLDMTGAVADFIDPTTKLDVLKKYIEQEKITDIFILDLLLMQNGINRSIDELKSQYNIRNVIVHHDSFINSLMPIPIRTFSSIQNFMNGYSNKIIRFSDAIKNSRYTPIYYGKDDDTILSLITHTSGTTTGIGKPVPLTDRNRNTLVKNYELGNFDYQPGMTMMHFIPYFAGYGAINTAHFGLSQGFELQQLPLFTPVDFGKYLDDLKSNIVFATPSCWLNLIRDERFKNIDLSYLMYASSGGGPLTKEEEQEINEFFYKHGALCVITKGYGLSETGGCCIYTMDGFNKIGSLGVRQPLVEILLRNQITGEIYPDSYVGQGEALIHSDAVTSGILDGKIIVPMTSINGKTYLPTKDILDRKEDGHYEYVERIDRMFPRYDGYNVYPLHIESLMQTYDEIDHCAIVPQFDENKNGMVPKMYIQLSEGTIIEDKAKFIESIITNSFLKHKENAPYKANYRDIPRSFVFLDRIPKNKMDKPNYPLLKQGVSGEEYIATIEEDNMGVSSITVNKNNLEEKKVLVKK